MMTITPYQTLGRNRTKSTVDVGWTNYITDSSIEAHCCNGNCFAKIVKTTKNLLPIMPSFEPPSNSFITENTQSINKALHFLESTLVCLIKSSQRLNLFSTTNLTLNQVLEVLSNFECFFRSLLVEKMSLKINDSTSNTPNDISISSHTSGLDFMCNSKITSNDVYQSHNIPTSHITRYNEFNYVLVIFLFAIDRIQFVELDSMFEQLCGIKVDDISIIDFCDIFFDEWNSIMMIFNSLNNNTASANTLTNNFDNCEENLKHNSFHNSFHKYNSMSDGFIEKINSNFEILKKRTSEEIELYHALKKTLKSKAEMLDLNSKIEKAKQLYHEEIDISSGTQTFVQSLPLLFSFHNMLNIQCVCHGPNDYHKYTLNFHLEAGRPIDIVRYVIKLRLYYYNDSNCATQVDLFLVTYRSFISLKDLVEILLGEVYMYFPEQNSEPNNLFYGSTILLIDVINNIFETGKPLGDHLIQLWRLMYSLLLRGRYNLALSLRKSLQHHMNMATNTISNLNFRASLCVEVHQQLIDPKCAIKQLLDLSPNDVAAQITHTDEEIFHSINLAEILHWFHLKYNQTSSTTSIYSSNSIDVGGESLPKIHHNNCDNNHNSYCSSSPPSFSCNSNTHSYRKACINMNRSTIRFHFIYNWTIKIINSTEKKSKKIKRIEYLLKLLDALFNLGNIHSAFAVYTGISSSKCNKIISQLIASNTEFNDIWYKLTHMTDITNSYESYRSVVNNLQPPFIPYLGITMTDINMLKLSMKDHLKGTNILGCNIKSHSIIALTPRNIIKLNDEILFKGTKLPSPSFDITNLDTMVNMRKLWRYFNVLRCNITKPRLVHYNISVDKVIQTIILSCDKLEIKGENLNNF